MNEPFYGLTPSSTSVFDALNRQIQTVYPDTTTAGTAYDAAGRRVAATNQDGLVTWFGYDGAGRLTSVTNALKQWTQYQYDEAGNEVAQIDALNRTTTYLYDGMGRRVAHTRPDNSAEEMTYDLAGNLVSSTNFNAGNPVVIFRQYDVLNRLTNLTDNTTFGYGYTYTATGQRQSMVENIGNYFVINYSYDARDRLLQKALACVQPGELNAALNYGYDLAGNVTSTASIFGNGVQLIYGYDALNRLTNVLSHGQLAAAYNYDWAGNLEGMRYGNAVTNSYQYDSLNRLTNLVWNYGSTALGAFAYQVKAGGTRTNLAERVNGGAAVNYQWSYDVLYRLTNEVVTGGSVVGALGYQYDAVGNRLARMGSLGGVAGQANTYTVDDWLSSDTYDTNGNTTASGPAYFSYDGLNRLTSSGDASFEYDGDGNRLWKTVNGVPTGYLVDDRNPSGYGQVVEEYEQDMGLAAQPVVLSRAYVYGLGLISEQAINTNTLVPGTLSYYGYDGHGNVRFLLATNGAITDTYTYDAFGNVVGSSGSTPNNYLYCGQQYDPDLGLYYNRARYLNVGTGRFWTSDTYEGNNEDPLSLHKYLYCQADPINRIDPSGLASYVGFDTVGWDSDGTGYGHVGIITHNPTTGIYTEFDHAHGNVATRSSPNLQEIFKHADGYGIVFIIPDQYDAALDTARANYKKHPGGSTIANNCLTSVIEIFKAAKVPYPDNGAIWPNMWLTAFWQANYGYIMLKPAAGHWIQKTVYGAPPINVQMISVTVETGVFY